MHRSFLKILIILISLCVTTPPSFVAATSCDDIECDHCIEQTDTTYDLTTENVACGDVVCIDNYSPSRGALTIQNKDCSAGSAVVIQNDPEGLAFINLDGAAANNFAIRLDNVQNARLTGTGYTGSTFGIKIDGGSNYPTCTDSESGTLQQGIWVDRDCDDITIDHVEVTNTYQGGIQVPNCDATAGHVDGLIIQENYVHDVCREALYTGCADNFTYSKNYLKNTGWNVIQLKYNSGTNEISKNYIENSGHRDEDNQSMGIGTGSDDTYTQTLTIAKNFIDTVQSGAIYINNSPASPSESTYYIDSNIIIDSGQDATPQGPKYAIEVDESKANITITNNTVVHNAVGGCISLEFGAETSIVENNLCYQNSDYYALRSTALNSVSHNTFEQAHVSDKCADYNSSTYSCSGADETSFNAAVTGDSNKFDPGTSPNASTGKLSYGDVSINTGKDRGDGAGISNSYTFPTGDGLLPDPVTIDRDPSWDRGAWEWAVKVRPDIFGHGTDWSMLTGTCATTCAGGWNLKVITSLNPTAAVTEVPNWRGKGITADTGGILSLVNMNEDCSIYISEVGGVTDVSGAGDQVDFKTACTIFAGQTAPGKGLTVTGRVRVKGATNLYIGHLRSRITNEETCGDDDALAVEGVGSNENVVFDHYSASWGTDENIQIFTPWPPSTDEAGNITVWKSITAEGIWDGCQGPHSMGLLVSDHAADVDPVSIIYNLMVHNYRRNPRIAGEQAYIANNFIHNWGTTGTQLADAETGAKTVDIIGNYYQAGVDYNTAQTASPIHIESSVHSDSVINIDDNFCDGLTCVDNDSGASIGTSMQLTPSGFTPIASAGVKAAVLADVGAFSANPDPVDACIKLDALNDTGEGIDAWNEVGGCGYGAGPPNYNLDTTTPTVEHTDFPANPWADSGNGYTNFEVWAQGFYYEVEGYCVPEKPSITNPTPDPIETEVPLFEAATSSVYADKSECSTSHISSDWEVDTDTQFLSPDRYSYDNATSKVTWTPPAGWLPNMGQYLRVRYTNAIGDSLWSNPVYFETVGDPVPSGAIALLITGDNNTFLWNIINGQAEESTGIKIASGATGNKFYNGTIVNCGANGIDVDESVIIKNTILYNNAGPDIDIATGKTVTASNNSIQDSAKTGDGTYDSNTSDFSTSEIFYDFGIDYRLRRSSYGIDKGTSTIYNSVQGDIVGKNVTDALGDPVSGAEIDIGAAESNPFLTHGPMTMGFGMGFN